MSKSKGAGQPSPAHEAVRARNFEALAALRPDDVDRVDRGGRSALFEAIVNADEPAVAELIRKGANVNLADRTGETPLHAAARGFQLGIAGRLLIAGAAVDAVDENGNSSLWRAVFESRGRSEMIALLLKAGASRSLANKHGISPLDLAEKIANYDLKPFLS
jgi:ankyrin repeat protein